MKVRSDRERIITTNEQTNGDPEIEKGTEPSEEATAIRPVLILSSCQKSSFHSSDRSNTY